jgi:DNA mismatch endonuclease (patch repair protein)
MVDVHTPAQRSFNMSRIKGRDTKPEILVRSLLHRAGFRFRKNLSKLAGKPDLVLPKYNTAIFVHGCYWHRHCGCRYATVPSTNAEFWLEKFRGTVVRDDANQRSLTDVGWRVLTVWECELKHNAVNTLEKLIGELRGATIETSTTSSESIGPI